MFASKREPAARIQVHGAGAPRVGAWAQELPGRPARTAVWQGHRCCNTGGGEGGGSDAQSVHTQIEGPTTLSGDASPVGPPGKHPSGAKQSTTYTRTHAPAHAHARAQVERAHASAGVSTHARTHASTAPTHTSSRKVLRLLTPSAGRHRPAPPSRHFRCQGSACQTRLHHLHPGPQSSDHSNAGPLMAASSYTWLPRHG